MASGHVNRANKAEHMAAPHRNLRREDFPCQFGAVHTWPISVFVEQPGFRLLTRAKPRCRALPFMAAIARSGPRESIGSDLGFQSISFAARDWAAERGHMSRGAIIL